MPITSKRLVISGDCVELSEYAYSIMYGVPLGNRSVNKIRQRIVGRFDPKALSRSRKRLRRIMECNAWHWKSDEGKVYRPIFVTLTFKDQRIVDLVVANRFFTNFIERFNYKLGLGRGYLKYLSVPEFQKDVDFYGRIKPYGGTVHFHVVFFNLPFVADIYDELARIWSNGFIIVRSADSLRGLVVYLSKYLTKQNYDSRFWGKKKFFVSRGLKKPVVVRDEEMVDIYMSYYPKALPDFKSVTTLGDSFNEVTLSRFVLPKIMSYVDLLGVGV